MTFRCRREHLCHSLVFAYALMWRGQSPKKAMSYFSRSLDRHGQYGSRPNVDMPEKTESACPSQSWVLDKLVGRVYLCSTITGYRSMCVIPKTLVGSCDWLLIMVAMCKRKCSIGEKKERLEEQHGDRESKSGQLNQLSAAIQERYREVGSRRRAIAASTAYWFLTAVHDPLPFTRLEHLSPRRCSISYG